MTRQCQMQLICRNAVTIVRHADTLDSALRQIDIDTRRTCIQAVFQQFFHRRRGAFDHLAGGDLIGQEFREYPDCGLAGQ